MAKFQKGDVVRRIKGDHLGMGINDTATVVDFYDDKRMTLDKWNVSRHGRDEVTHDPRNFELATPAIVAKLDFGNGDVRTVEFDPNGKSLNEPGAKADAGKLRPTLIIRDMARALEAVIKIATDGAAKYTPGGWLEVPNGGERYEDADLRHMLKRFKGEPVDKDSKSLHLAHEAWNALAKLELHLREEERNAVAS